MSKKWNEMTYQERREFEREFEYKGYKCKGTMGNYSALMEKTDNGCRYLYAHSIKALKFKIDCYLDEDLFNRHYQGDWKKYRI